MGTNEDSTSSIEKIEILLDYENQILECKDLIETTLDEQLRQVESPTQDHIILGLEIVLSSVLDDEDVSEVIYPLMNFIALTDSADIQYLREHADQQVFVKFLTRLSATYQTDINRVIVRHNQGPNFWENINSDVVIRSPGNVVGLDHKIRREGGIDEISVNGESNLHLISYFLQQQLRLLEHYPEEAVEQMDTQDIETIIGQVEDLRERYNTVVEQD